MMKMKDFLLAVTCVLIICWCYHGNAGVEEEVDKDRGDNDGLNRWLHGKESTAGGRSSRSRNSRSSRSRSSSRRNEGPPLVSSQGVEERRDDFSRAVPGSTIFLNPGVKRGGDYYYYYRGTKSTIRNDRSVSKTARYVSATAIHESAQGNEGNDGSACCTVEETFLMLPEPSFSTKISHSQYHYTIPVILGGASLELALDSGSGDLVVLQKKDDEGDHGSDKVKSELLVGPDFGTQNHELLVDGVVKTFRNIEYRRAGFRIANFSESSSSFSSSSSSSSDTLSPNSSQTSSVARTVNNLAFLQSDTLETFPQRDENDTSWPDLHQWQLVDGIIGLSFSTTSLFAADLSLRNVSFPLEAMFQSSGATRKVFAIDVTSQQQEDHRFHVGGIPKEMKDLSIAWSERQPFDPYQFHHHILPIYDMQICGASILGNFSTHWNAVIDMGAVCLSLPNKFFRSIMLWIPSECKLSRSTVIPGFDDIDDESDDEETDENGRGDDDRSFPSAPPSSDDAESTGDDGSTSTEEGERRCLVPQDVDHTKLPKILFRLSEQGPLVYISLSDLLLDVSFEGEPRKAYCIQGSGAIDWTRPNARPISIGSMALKSFVTVIDADTGSVGFAQYPLLTPEDETENEGEGEGEENGNGNDKGKGDGSSKRRRLDLSKQTSVNMASRALSSTETSGDANANNETLNQFALCAEPANCVGEQIFIPALNVCRDPPCERFFFRTMDSSSKTCSFTAGFQMVVFLPLTVCICADLGMQRSLMKITRRLRRLHENFGH